MGGIVHGGRRVRSSDDEFPARLRPDPSMPSALWCVGDLRVLERPTVAIVGTRRCTRYGRDLAAELGRLCAQHGICVVSGLALGIDGAAHHGALSGSGPVAGVAGTGLDVVYPRRHERLWHEVAEAGVLLSESEPGSAPDPWRFPRRNRILAALADLVVVVESRTTGGALITAEEAFKRSVPVMAVPGSVRSPASAGTNRLIEDGAAPLCEPSDVIAACFGAQPARTATTSASGEETSASPDERVVLDAMGWDAATVGDLAVGTGLALGTLAETLADLAARGAITERDGWWERVDSSMQA